MLEGIDLAREHIDVAQRKLVEAMRNLDHAIKEMDDIPDKAMQRLVEELKYERTAISSTEDRLGDIRSHRFDWE